jgi:hypothetical protein
VILVIIAVVSVMILQGGGENQSVEPQKVTQEDVAAAFNEAIETHPLKEIREDLVDLIESGQVGFFYYPDGYEVMGTTKGYTVGGNTIPTLVVFPGFAWGLPTKEDRWSALVHEYQHLKEMLETGVDGSRWEGDVDDDKARAMYEFEVRGYRAQCDFEYSIAMDPRSVVCEDFDEFGEQGFRQWIAEFLMDIASQVNLQGHRDIVFDQARRGP